MTTFVKVGTASADKISSSMPGAASAKSCDPHCQEVTISPSLCCKPLSNLYATEAISFRPTISGGKPLFLTCSVSKCEMLLDCPCSLLHRAVFLQGIHVSGVVTIRPIISGGKPLFLTCSVSKCQMLLRVAQRTSQEEGLAPARYCTE